MRLLTKTTLYFLIAMIPLLAAAGFYLFNQFSKEINRRVDEELINDEIQWIRYLKDQADIGTTFILKTPELSIYPVRAEVSPYPDITDTYGFSFKKNTRVPFRQLSHVVPVNAITYQIIIRKSQEQKTQLEANVTRIMLLVFAGLFIATLLFNWLISKRIWEPFQRSLVKIRKAELHKMEALRFEAANIKEFNELNESLNSMSSKIHSDYVNMKEFTENAAHEMQTPLAVVQSKLELLLQDTNLNAGQVESILQASSALNRLSKLNQALLLLAKIENNQYETNETANLTETTKKYLKLFEEVIKHKKLSIQTDFESDFSIPLHPLLAESLVSNLVGNAIKYNHEEGKVIISVNQTRFEIINSSDLPAIDKDQLFKRFHKTHRTDETSNGLGLAIIKKIADIHGLMITYDFENGHHRFVLEKKR